MPARGGGQIVFTTLNQDIEPCLSVLVTCMHVDDAERKNNGLSQCRSCSFRDLAPAMKLLWLFLSNSFQNGIFNGK